MSNVLKPPLPPSIPDSISNANSNPPIPSHLSLLARLSRAPFIPATILLVFSLSSLASQLASIQRGSESTKNALNNACNSAELIANNAVALPATLARVTRGHLEKAANGAIETFLRLLDAAVDLLLALVWLFISRYTRLFVCATDLVLQASLGALKEAAEQITDWIDDRAAEIADQLVNSLDALGNWLSTTESQIRSGFQGFVESLVGIGTAFGAAPLKVDFTSGQQVLKFPAVWDGLMRLKAGLPLDAVDKIKQISVPSLESLEDRLRELVGVPFEMLKSKVKESLGGVKLVMPTVNGPDKVEFCTKMETAWVDEVAGWAARVVWIGAGAVVATWIFAVIWECGSIYARHVGSTTWTRVMGALGSRVKVTSSAGGTDWAWFVEYVNHFPSLMMIAAGFAGMLLCALEIRLAWDLETRIVESVQTHLQQTAETLQQSVSRVFATELERQQSTGNLAITSIENVFNVRVFGWADGAVTAINDTMSSFSGTITQAINSALSGVPWFQSALNGFLKCYVGNQIAVLQALAGMLHKNLALKLPRINLTSWIDDPLLIGAAERSLETVLVGSGNRTGLITGIATALDSSIRSQMLFFGVVFVLGLCVPLLGLAKLAFDRIQVELAKRRSSGASEPQPLPSKTSVAENLSYSAEILDIMEKSPFPAASSYVLRRTSLQSQPAIGQRRPSLASTNMAKK